MTIPSQFARDLHSTFGGRYRIRWSDRLHTFQLEQKIQTGQVDLMPPVDEDGTYDTHSDRWVRARDGFAYIMALTPGDRMPCPLCNLTLKVPVMKTGETHCERCIAQGKDGKYVAAYFPFNHIFIEHLRKIDPYSDLPYRQYQAMKQRDQSRMGNLKRQALDNAGDATLDDKLQVFEIPHTGYGVKRAPVTFG